MFILNFYYNLSSSYIPFFDSKSTFAFDQSNDEIEDLKHLKFENKVFKFCTHKTFIWKDTTIDNNITVNSNVSTGKFQ